MGRSTLLGTARIPDTATEMKLHQHADRFSISIPGRGELMNTRVHGSERALAALACDRIGSAPGQRVLVGGLGVGFTAAAVLERVAPDAEVVVAELVPEVVDWNRRLIGEPSGHPLADPRCSVHIGDVADLLRAPDRGFDAVLLDVDNGPEALIRMQNDWLYSPFGLQAARRALRPGGVLAIWSASDDRRFTARLERAGFSVEQSLVRPHRKGRGARHVIWLAR